MQRLVLSGDTGADSSAPSRHLNIGYTTPAASVRLQSKPLRQENSEERLKASGILQVQLVPAVHGKEKITQTLYMFCCTRETCASQTDSWRAFTHSVSKQESDDITSQDVSGTAPASAPQALPASATEVSKGKASAAVGAEAWGLTNDDWQPLPANATGVFEGPAAVGVDAWGLAGDDWGVSAQEPADADAAELNSALEQLSMQSALQPQVLLPVAICARRH